MSSHSNHVHRFNYLETEFRRDGSREHRCMVPECDTVAVLPPLFFDNRTGRRVKKKTESKFFKPTGLLTEFAMPYWMDE